MYKRAYIFLVLFIVCIQFMQAQKSYSIKGIVKEAASGEPVPYATVVIWNTTQKEKHKVLTKSKKRKENTLWRTGNGVSATRILNFES